MAVPKHPAVVRVTHWITAVCFVALAWSGANIVTSHPRFYWGENGNVNTPALFQIPIPASRPYVETGYGYVLADRNGWSRNLHFQSAWILVVAGAVYAVFTFATRHFAKDLLPVRSSEGYNPLQRTTYLAVAFVMFPLIIWTGLAMSPAFVSAFPAAVEVVGGHQSARTIHFFLSLSLIAFLIGHVAMVWRAGFRVRTRAMITGREDA